MILKEKLEEVRQYESLIWNFSCQSADCDTELITIIREALNFSIQNLFIIHDGYKYEMYWFEIVNGSICGAVGTLLDKEERLKKSQNIANFFKVSSPAICPSLSLICLNQPTSKNKNHP